MTPSFWTHTVQILVMLGVAFALGVWLGYLLWHKWRRLHAQLKARHGELQVELDALAARSRTLDSEMSMLRSRLFDCENGRAVGSALAAPVTPDDLKVIEGIGPKIEKLCNAIGIYNFQQLAQTPVERLRKMLADAGPDYKVATPDTWPRQAGMAAAGQLKALKDYQNVLIGGREPG